MPLKKIIHFILHRTVNVPILGDYLILGLRQIKSTMLQDLLRREISSESKALLHIFGRKLIAKPAKERTKYLLCYGGSPAGLNHWTVNLNAAMSDSITLGRTLVLTKPSFSPSHNYGKSISPSWYKYYDIKTTMQEAGVDYIDHEAFIKKRFAKNTILFIDGKQLISKTQNEHYQVIVRNFVGCGLTYRSYLHPPKIKIKMYHSPGILLEAEKTLKELPKNYCAIQVRRGDRLLSKGWGEVTSPAKILEALKKYNPKKLPTYLMTDETNKKFYQNLESEFQIYRYYYFDNLVRLAKQKDNFQLYAVEKVILEKAKIKVRKHPYTEKCKLQS